MQVMKKQNCDLEQRQKYMFSSLLAHVQKKRRKSQYSDLVNDSKILMTESLKLERIFPQQDSSKKTGKINKSLSMEFQLQQYQRPSNLKPSERVKVDPIFREKQKLIIAKNQSLLTENSIKPAPKLQNPESLNTLKKLIKVQKSIKKQSLLTYVEELKQAHNQSNPQ